MLEIYIKNGFYIHFIHAFLYWATQNIYISSIIAIKLYSTNYFYWYGHHFTYLQNSRYNWIKQFVRFTDTGHLASILPLFFTSSLPLAHNIHFIIMAGYWIGKLAFNLKDADKLNLKDNYGWHTDVCTYIHHSVPYLLIHYLFLKESQSRSNCEASIQQIVGPNCEASIQQIAGPNCEASIQQIAGPLVCANEYNYQTLQHTYLWLYSWLFFIYIPWRFYTGDTVYSILDIKQTPKKHIFGFVFFMHVLAFMSNYVGRFTCELYPN